MYLSLLKSYQCVSSQADWCYDGWVCHAAAERAVSRRMRCELDSLRFDLEVTDGR